MPWPRVAPPWRGRDRSRAFVLVGGAGGSYAGPDLGHVCMRLGIVRTPWDALGSIASFSFLCIRPVFVCMYAQGQDEQTTGCA